MPFRRELVKGHAKRERVRMNCQVAPARCMLRRHIALSAYRHARGSESRPIEVAREPNVHEHVPSVRRNDNVLRLDVAVHDAFQPQGVDGVADVVANLNQPVRHDRSFRWSKETLEIASPVELVRHDGMIDALNGDAY